ncbi:GNAT family N-acetyltransferase, partial [Arthrospira platensis SPKY2]
KINNDMNIIKESNDASKFIKDYKNKKYVDLNSFNKTQITEAIAKKYNICSVADIKGYLYTDKNNSFVALVAVGTYKDKKSWIQPIEVAKKYRGRGLSKQLIDIAVNELGAKYLGVFIDNKVAIYIYKKYGFKVFKIVSDGTAYFMTIDPKQKIDKKYNNINLV